MTRQQKRSLRREAHFDAMRTFARSASKSVIDVHFTHRQRMAEWLRLKAQRSNKCDTALLPWQLKNQGMPMDR